MSAPLALRPDYDGAALRLMARSSADANQSRRLPALASLYEGSACLEAARQASVTPQIVRDWVARFNADGPDGLIDRTAPGQVPTLNSEQLGALLAQVEAGPMPAVDGVVRWRIVDLVQWGGDQLTISNTGMTAGAMAAGSAPKLIVDTVSAGVITALRIVDTGGYTNTASQTGQTLPNGTQSLVSLTGLGTGATCTGTFAAAVYDAGDRHGAMGFAQRGVAAADLPSIGFLAAGDRVDLWITNSWARLAAFAKAPTQDVIIALGRNDIDNGSSAATIVANHQARAKRFKALGAKRVRLSTVTPATTSTTTAGQSTLADQVVPGTNATVREVLKASIQAIPAGIDSCVDIAAAVEGLGANAGKWMPIGGLPAAADGEHPGISALLAVAAVMQSAAAAFGSSIIVAF